MARARFTVEQVVEAIDACGGMQYLAAKRLGCSYQTILNYREKHEAVAEAVARNRGEMVDHAESKLLRAIKRGEPWSITFVLKTLGKDRGYVERQETADPDRPLVAVIGGIDIQVVIGAKRGIDLVGLRGPTN